MSSETFQQVYKTLLSEQVSPDDILLDIGSKDGLNTEYISESLGLTAIAVDIKFQLDDNEPSCELLQADGHQLPLEDNSVDAIISNMVLEHVPDEGAMIKEIARVMKPSGIFVLIFPNRVWPLDGHGFPPGMVWLPRRIGIQFTELFDWKPEYYSNAMYPSSALGVRNQLNKLFKSVRYESQQLLEVDYRDSRKGEILKTFDSPLSTVFETSMVRFLVEATFPVTIYVAQNPIKNQ